MPTRRAKRARWFKPESLSPWRAKLPKDPCRAAEKRTSRGQRPVLPLSGRRENHCADRPPCLTILPKTCWACWSGQGGRPNDFVTYALRSTQKTLGRRTRSLRKGTEIIGGSPERQFTELLRLPMQFRRLNSCIGESAPEIRVKRASACAPFVCRGGQQSTPGTNCRNGSLQRPGSVQWSSRRFHGQ